MRLFPFCFGVVIAHTIPVQLVLEARDQLCDCGHIDWMLALVSPIARTLEKRLVVFAPATPTPRLLVNAPTSHESP